MEWKEDKDAGTNESLGKETKANITPAKANITPANELENIGSVLSNSLEEGEFLNDGKGWISSNDDKGWFWRPPRYIQDYVSGQDLSDKENIDMAHLALFSGYDPLTYEDAVKSSKWRQVMNAKIKTIMKNYI